MREHYRCAPVIIGFAIEFYRGEFIHRGRRSFQPARSGRHHQQGHPDVLFRRRKRNIGIATPHQRLVDKVADSIMPVAGSR
jgi:hypothetical protein